MKQTNLHFNIFSYFKACRCGFNDIIKLLLLYGANFAIINKMGINALRIAKENPNKNIRDNLVNYISRYTFNLLIEINEWIAMLFFID